MNISMDSVLLVATVTEFDSTEWASQSASIPSDYTINFTPMVDEAELTALNTGRQINYTRQLVYTTTPLGNGYVSTPSYLTLQQLLPLPDDSSTTESSS